jgi:hypothetical protein
MDNRAKCNISAIIIINTWMKTTIILYILQIDESTVKQS